MSHTVGRQAVGSLLGLRMCALTVLVSLLTSAVFVSGCTYEQAVSVQQTPGARLESTDKDRYGEIRLVWSREYRKPTGISQFPDGGRPFEVAMYATILQVGAGVERDVGRIDLPPVRRGDFGNLNDFAFKWLSPNRLWYRVDYGYYGDLSRTVEGEVDLAPLR